MRDPLGNIVSDGDTERIWCAALLTAGLDPQQVGRVVRRYCEVRDGSQVGLRDAIERAGAWEREQFDIGWKEAAQ